MPSRNHICLGFFYTRFLVLKHKPNFNKIKTLRHVLEDNRHVTIKRFTIRLYHIKRNINAIRSFSTNDVKFSSHVFIVMITIRPIWWPISRRFERLASISLWISTQSLGCLHQQRFIFFGELLILGELTVKHNSMKIWLKVYSVSLRWKEALVNFRSFNCNRRVD